MARIPRKDLPLPEFWYRVYPELRHFRSREEMRQVKRAFQKDKLTRRRTWLLVVIMALLASGASYLLVRLLLSLGLPNWLATVLNMLFWAMLGAGASLFFWHRPYIRFVRRYLQERGTPICLRCGYDLRGQTIPRCPECGTTFDPGLLEDSPGER